MPIRLLLNAIIVVSLILLVFYPLIDKYHHFNNHIYQTCQFVYARVIPTSTNLTEWLQSCRKKSRTTYSQLANLERQLTEGNAILSELKISHLELFNEKESEAIWTDTDLENGLEARFIDGELVITRVHPNSEGARKVIQRGDRVLLSKTESLSPYELNRWKGKLKFLRGKTEFEVDLIPKVQVIKRDMSVMGFQGVKVLSVESFKSQYFSDQKINKIKSQIHSTDKIIIDLRGNNGGNFVAGLRLLSSFICEPTVVGYMKKDRELGRIGYFENNLEDDYQIEVLNKFDSVGLKTFKNSNCFPKPIALLIDAYSKSTSEWVALAFRETLDTPIMGATSAGELLVGIWYDVSHIWGSVVKLSIPEAYYESINHYQIEGQGVSVDKTLYPRRIDYEQGYDSEIVQVVKSL